MGFVSEFIRDLRQAARVLRKSPVATCVAILALALGIGVNASSFVGVDAMILRPLPYPRLDRIVTVWETLPKAGAQRNPLAAADFFDLQEQSHSFEKLAAYRGWEVSLTGVGNPEHVRAFLVTPGFFSVLGTQAALGRTFSSDDERVAAKDVVVVSEGFWKSHLAAARDAAGKSITLDGRAYAIAGVMPDDFDFPLGTDIWAPLIPGPAARHDRATHDLMGIGLLKPDVSAARAGAEAAAIAARLAERYPTTNEGRGMLTAPLRDLAEGVTSHFVWTLLGASGFVLLLACANVGNLHMARAANRRKEMAVRVALGASRFQIARQLLAESVLISAAAGVLGLLLASWDSDRTMSQLPALVLRLVPGLRNMRIDSTAILFTLALSLAAGILCSLPAMLHLVYGGSRTNPADALRERSSSSPGAAGSRMRAALIVSELAMALVLLTGAGFMVQIFNHLLDRDQGFDPRNALTMQVSLPAAGYSQSAGVVSFYDRALEGLASVPGVTAAGLSSSFGPAERLDIEGRPEARPGDTRPEVVAIGGRYLDAMRIPLLAGRPISDRDRRDSPRIVVVSQSVARYYWPGSSPIGRHIRIGDRADWLTVAGVCGDIRPWFTGTAQAAAYIPYSQSPPSSATFVLRTAGEPLQAAAAARSAIAGIDHDMPVYEVTTLEQTDSDLQSGVRGAAVAMSTYALIALLLAVTGVYAVISYFVAARTHDIGIRMALGAGRTEVLGMIARQTARLTAAALACGIPLAIVLTRVMASALYADIRAGAGRFALLTAALIAAALAATYFPARRAMNIDPMTALRDE